MNIKFSIIIPVYNVEAYIAKTINSIISQSFANFELILVDDGSTDNSIAIAENLLLKSDINYRIVKKKNGGVSSARNIGIENAIGDYLYFLDSDDYIQDNFLEIVNKEINKDDVDVLFCGFDNVDENEKVIASYDVNLKGDIAGEEMAIKMVYGESYVNMIVGIYKREIILQNKIFFDEDIKVAEDFRFTIRVLLESKRVKPIDKILVKYVKRASSVMNKPSLKCKDSYKSHLRTLEYCYENNKSTTMIKAMEHYRIPISICGIAITLASSKEFEKEYYEFLGDSNVRKFVKGFKPRGWSISNLKYMGICIGVAYLPKILRKYYRK